MSQTSTAQLRRALRQASDYESWQQAAERLDNRTGMNAWKADDRADAYDHWLIRSRLQQLRRLRRGDDVLGLVHFLRQGLHWNLGGIGSGDLYSACESGTKHLIDDYIDEVCTCLQQLRDSRDPSLSPEAKLQFFEETALSFGRSALMLSGGATLGLFHVGVIKALWDADCLPRVISGSSAGSVVAATLGTRSDDELEEMFEAERAQFGFWRGLSVNSMVKRRALMDQAQVRRGIQKHVANLTFKEAYEKTGRIINITVSSARSNQTPKLVNHLTFPHLYVREAVLASCAVPVVFEPVVLYSRDQHGNKVPFMPSVKWVDGSMKSDLPRLRLRRLHNVNHFIVSQTNPHVVPFLTVSGPKTKQGLVAAARRFAFATAKEQTKLVAKLGADLLPSGNTRDRFDTLHGLLNQDYRGNITILPRFHPRSFVQMLSNPSLSQTEQFILEGQRATWPKLAMIKHQTRISRTFEQCLQSLRGGTVQDVDQSLRGAQLTARDVAG